CRDLLFLPVDRIRVRGRYNAVDVFEPLCAMDAADAAMRERVQHFEQALAAYRRRAVVAAQAQFQQLAAAAAVRPDGRPPRCQCFLTRIETFLQQPPAADWDGIHVYAKR